MEVIVGGYKVSSESQDSQKRGGISSQLTDREIELIKLIGEELTMKEIADKIFLSEHTVFYPPKEYYGKVRCEKHCRNDKKSLYAGAYWLRESK